MIPTGRAGTSRPVSAGSLNDRRINSRLAICSDLCARPAKCPPEAGRRVAIGPVGGAPLAAPSSQSTNFI
ncbi:hypothetical protein [Nevskia sp.]|uniref:hypothetical protein n=1 Tax=Nevskia sp. TaxID=1929292 RepID=UPI003F6E8EC5